MIIRDLHVERVAFRPLENDAPLIVHNPLVYATQNRERPLRSAPVLLAELKAGTIAQLLDEWTAAAGLRWKLDGDEVVIH